MTTLAVVTIMSPTLLAETELSIKLEATKTKAAGSINPPNLRDTCNEAKQNATQKAANIGYKDAVCGIT